MRDTFILSLICLLLFPILLSAQPSVEEFKEIFRLEAEKAVEEIIIDGIPNESTWEKASIGANFWQKVPYFAEGADPKTEVMLSYNDDFLYCLTAATPSLK